MSEKKHNFSWRLDGGEAIQKGFVEPFSNASTNYRAMIVFKESINDAMRDIFKRDYEKLSRWSRLGTDGRYQRWVEVDGMWSTGFSKKIVEIYKPTENQEYFYGIRGFRDQTTTSKIYQELHTALRYYRQNLEKYGDYTSLYLEKEWQDFILKFNNPVSTWINEEDFFLNGEPLNEGNRKKFLEMSGLESKFDPR